MKTLVAATAAMLAATSAQAQYGPHPSRPAYPGPDQPYIAYADVPRDDRVFTGARIEAHIAYDRLRLDLDDDDVSGGGRGGFGYGGEVGFDLPVGGGIVLGGYAGADGSTIRDCEALSTTGTLCVRPGRSLYAGGRIGVPIGNSLLLYARGGYTNGQIRLDGHDTLVAANNLSVHRNLNGYHVGGGVEAALSPSTYSKLEYVYTRLNDDGGDDHFVRQQVQAGFGFRFR